MIARLFAAGAIALALQGIAAAKDLGLTLTGQPERWQVASQDARVLGFGTARFGMTTDQVRATAAADFGQDVAAALKPERVEPGFTALGADLPKFVTVVPAHILYVFDPAGKLHAVNLNWVVKGAATPAQRSALIDAAARFTAQFLGQRWKVLATVRGRALGPNEVMVFAAADELGNGAEVHLFGVDYQLRAADGTTRPSPHARGPAALRLVLSVDVDRLNAITPDQFIAGAAAGNPPSAPTQLSGLRSVAFGMTAAEVRAHAAADFGVAPAAVTELPTIDGKGALALQLNVPQIKPGPGPATVTYIFSKDQGLLTHINIAWATVPAPTPGQREGMLVAGQRLAACLKRLPRPPAEADDGGVAGPGDLVVYHARDELGRSLQVTLEGVPFRQDVDGKPEASQPTGPARLRINYAWNPDHPSLSPPRWPAQPK